MTHRRFREIEIIDLKPGMRYRRFPSRDWQTVDTVEFSACENRVTVRDVEGGWCSGGSGTLVYIKEVES
jgi:hypothetical protein